jgi:hypothetical protein
MPTWGARYRWLSVLAALVAGGCGDPLAGGGYRPAYVTIRGHLTSMAAWSGDTYVALLWRNTNGGGFTYTAQQVQVRPELTTFSLDLAALPPPDSMQAFPQTGDEFTGIDPKMRWAAGTLVVYADDGNGKLDFVNHLGDANGDRILAAADGFLSTPDLRILYLASGEPADKTLWAGEYPVTPGFSLAHEGPRVDPAPGDCGGFDSKGHWADECEAGANLGEPLSFDDIVELTEVEDDSLQRYACRSFWGPFDFADWWLLPADEIGDGPEHASCYGYQCLPDLPPPGVPVTCNADQTAYVYKTCFVKDDLCGTRFCHFGHGERQADAPVPDGWPCH